MAQGSRQTWMRAVRGGHALLALAGPHGRAGAAQPRGTLLGTITDTSGGAVPGATVTITEQGTNIVTSGGDQRERVLYVPEPQGRHLSRRGRAQRLQEGRT